MANSVQKFCRAPYNILSQMDKTIFEISRRRAMAGFRFVSDALPFGRLWYGEPNAVSNAIDYAKFLAARIML